MRNMIRGMLVGILLSTSVFTVNNSLASGFTKTIEANFNKVILMVNGNKIMSDNILYKGTTYIPIRAVAEMLGKEVVWETEKFTAHINDEKRPVIDVKITEPVTQPVTETANFEQVKPTLIEFKALSGTSIQATFSEKLTESSAETISNYMPTTQFGSNFKLTILKAELDASQTSVVLTTNAQMAGNLYNVDILNVTDLAGNAMDLTNRSFAGINPAPAVSKSSINISNITATTKNTIDITLTDVVDKNSAESIGNYAIKETHGAEKASLSIMKAELNAAGNKITLTTSDQVPSNIYTVTLNNITDGSGKVIVELGRFFVGYREPIVELKVSGVMGLTSESVQLYFNVNVDVETASKAINYTIYEPSNASAIISPVSVTVNGDKVLLTVVPLKPASIYEVKIEGVKSTAGSTIVPVTMLFTTP